MRRRRGANWVAFTLVQLKTTSFQPMKMSFSFQSTCSDRLHTLSTLRDPCRTLIPKNLACLRNMVYGKLPPSPSMCPGWIILPVAFEPPHDILRLSRTLGSREVSSPSPSPSHGLAQGPPLYPVYLHYLFGSKCHLPLPPPFSVSVVLMRLHTISKPFPKLDNS